MSLKTNRPKNYRPIKDVLSFIKGLKKRSKFYMGSIDGYLHGKFVKFEDKTLYYTMITNNPVVSTKKIHKVMLHRIKFIKQPLKSKSKIKSDAPKYSSFNLNHNIRVRLTDLGYQRLADASKYLASQVPDLDILDVEYFKGQADKDGYTTFQMWEFMKQFGEVTGLCKPEYYHLDILISHKDLDDYKPLKQK